MPRSRSLEAEEASIHLSTVQTQFSHHSIEYAYQLNMIKAGKGHQILDNVSWNIEIWEFVCWLGIAYIMFVYISLFPDINTGLHMYYC